MTLNYPVKAAIVAGFGLVTLNNASETIKDAAAVVSHLYNGVFSESLASGAKAINNTLWTYAFGLGTLGTAQSDSFYEFKNNINTRTGSALGYGSVAVNAAAKAALSVYKGEFAASLAYGVVSVLSTFGALSSLAPR